MKSFLVAVAKIALALCTAGLVLAGVTWGVVSYRGSQQQAREAPAKELKPWPPYPLVAIDDSLRATLKTKWVEGAMKFQFEVDGYPGDLANALASLKPNYAWILLFLDKDGFEVARHEVPLHEMTRTVNDQGLSTGLTMRGDIFLSAESYQRATTWDVSWRFPTKPKPVSTRSTTGDSAVIARSHAGASPAPVRDDEIVGRVDPRRLQFGTSDSTLVWIAPLLGGHNYFWNRSSCIQASVIPNGNRIYFKSELDAVTAGLHRSPEPNC